MGLLDTPSGKSAIAFGAVSLFTSLIGRIAVTKFFFDYPIVILMLQNATALLGIEVLRVLNVVKLAPYSFDKGRHLFVLSVLLSTSSWLVVASFEGIGMPTFDAVTKCTPLFALLGSSLFYRKQKFNEKQIGAIIAISVFCGICVNFELSLDRYSVFYGLISALLQVTAYLQLENLSTTFQPLDLLYMNSFNSLVVFLLADIVQDEIRDAFMYMMTSANMLFTFVLFVLLVSGVVLQYVTIHCICMNGSINTTVVSNVISAVQIMLAYYGGVYLFYDVTPLFINWIALVAGLIAGASLYKNAIPVNEKQRCLLV